MKNVSNFNRTVRKSPGCAVRHSRKEWVGVMGLFLVLISQPLLADGTIKGRVFDQNTSEALPAANVMIKGTSIGAAADLKGNYIIPNVPTGVYTILVRYIGYEQKNYTVTVPVRGTIVQDFGLKPAVVQGEKVTVTAQAVGQMQAISQQLASDKIASVVSEARIQELPDFNAAQAISRLPGVSTLESSGEANKVVIRGLAPQYNVVAIEGTKLASTGSSQIGAASQGGTSGSISTDRSVDISMVSPYMVQSISVFKSLTPDMNANAIGGVVNMELREAPAELHYDLLWQSGYTQKSNTFGNFRVVGSVSKRFFNDLFGVYVLGNAERYDRDADNMTASYVITKHEVDPSGFDPVSVNDVQLNRHIETRYRFGGNLILDLRLPSGSIKSVNMFTQLNSDYQDYRTALDYRNKNLNFTYRAGDNNIDQAVNSLNFKYDLGFMSVDLKFANTSSKNIQPESPYLQFSQTGGITGAVPDNTIPDSLTHLITYLGPEKTYLGNVNLFSSEYKENNQAYTGHLKFPFTLSKYFSGYLKFGAEYHHEDHKNDQSTPYARLDRGSLIQREMMDDLIARFGIDYDPINGQFPASEFTSDDPDLTREFLDNRFGGVYWAADPGILMDMAHYLASNPAYSGTNVGGWFNGYYQTLPNDYHYTENYTGAYLMSEMNFPMVMMVGGVRYEKVKSEFNAFNLVDGRDPRTQTYIPITVYPENEFFLPMGQIKFKPFFWGDIRYAYTESLARPDYHQLSPHFNMDYSHNNVWAGNPDLKTAHAYNHDLVLSLHFNELGLFAIGGFYKTIKDFTYYTQYKLHATAPPGLESISSFDPAPKDGAMLYTYINSPYEAYVKGFEIDYQTNLWYLPSPLKGIVLGANYTHIWSEATYPWRDDISRPNPNPPPRMLVTVLDSTRVGRLINQPNDIANAYIGFDYRGFSYRLSFVFQGNSVSYIGAFQEQDGFTRDYFRIDTSWRQKLPWYGLEVYMDGFNLNNAMNTSAQRSIGGFTREQHYGLTVNLGIRARL